MRPPRRLLARPAVAPYAVNAVAGYVSAPADGPLWSPLMLGASLLAWWTADTAGLITLNGTAVTSWKDVVAGYDAVQGVSAARPLYSATSFNGVPSVTFDGTDDELTLASQPFPSGADLSEMWAVVEQDDAAGSPVDRSFIGYGGVDFTSHRRAFRVVSTGVNRAQARTGTGGASINTLETATDFSSRHLVRVQFGTTETAVSVDDGTAETGAAVPATGTTRSRIGASSANAAAANFWLGKIRDVLITGPLSAAQVTDLNAWALPRRML